MKAKEVLNLLRCTRSSLSKYVKTGLIKVTKKANGVYEYDEESVYKFLNKNIKRKTYLYARVSTNKQNKDLDNQIDLLKTYCFNNGIIIDGIFTDISSGISFNKRNDFFKLLDLVLEHKVENVIIAYKDRLSRVGFELFQMLFEKFGCKITVVSEIGSEKLDSEEIFDEIVSLLHCYSMKIYSNRKREKIEELIRDDNL